MNLEMDIKDLQDLVAFIQIVSNHTGGGARIIGIFGGYELPIKAVQFTGTLNTHERYGLNDRIYIHFESTESEEIQS